MAADNLSQILKVATEAALLAGQEIRNAWDVGGEVKNTKSNATDLVTETDQRCEELVIGLLKQRFPGHQIIGEETANASKYELTDGPTWTIDPIDGTTNFVHRLALSCVIVSFLRGREVLVGVVYDPKADELFYATRGGGAFLCRPLADGAGGAGGGGGAKALVVSSTTSLARAAISMDPGYGRDSLAVAAFTAQQGAVLRRGVRTVRVLGSTGLTMAYVACGRLDACFEVGSWDRNLGPKLWDFTAGRLLVEEAGGVTRDISAGLELPTGRRLDLLQRSVFCAASPSLAAELMEALAEAREAPAPGGAGASGAAKRPRGA